jgi:hypothetical protein
LDFEIVWDFGVAVWGVLLYAFFVENCGRMKDVRVAASGYVGGLKFFLDRWMTKCNFMQERPKSESHGSFSIFSQSAPIGRC